ncbi:MgtC/SapB family protein [Bosea sp. 117]|uniref:MgtC/SapB family protein n=1 Tax=Bosea sp. 117 TaxID=1125973 RepID=UPI000689724C|nr:MgtC/SapB family protein [Bosea sp. 117]
MHGLTTAATVWVTASLGIACALASWPLIVGGTAMTLILLVLVHPFEHMLEHRAAAREQERRERVKGETHGDG